MRRKKQTGVIALITVKQRHARSALRISPTTAPQSAAPYRNTCYAHQRRCARARALTRTLRTCITRYRNQFGTTLRSYSSSLLVPSVPV